MSTITAPRPAPEPTAEGAARASRVGSHAAARPGSAPSSQRDPLWAHLALAALLVATGILYFWNLTANGYANSFYSAAVQAGSESWKAFFYGSFDAASAITVDKPPASLWLMALSVRLFGLSSLSILLPQVLMGIGTVLVVNRTVRRTSGIGAGLLAGAAMALTPVAVLMFRFNNPDALLVLLMTLGAWATVRAIQKGSIRWMALVGAFIGLAFLTKTLQAFLVVPFFGLAWVLCADTTVRRRLWGALAAVGTLVVMGGWWVAIVELVPASMRPYIGGSQTNSFLELTFGYNGLGRISGDETGSVGGGRSMGSESMGITRMFSEATGGQISWLLPAALLLLVAGLIMRARRPRTDLTRASLIVWGGWLLVTALVFSFMAGIFHDYYTVALAPAIAAVVGIGAAEAWRCRAGWAGRGVLAAASLLTGIWGFVLLSRTDAYGDWLRITVVAAGIVGALGFLVIHRIHRSAIAGVIAASLIAAFAGQAAYAVTTVTTAKTGSIITAGPSTGGPGSGRPGGGGGQGGPGGQSDPGGQGGPGGQGVPGGGAGQGQGQSQGQGQGGPGSAQQGQGSQQNQASSQNQTSTQGASTGAQSDGGGGGGMGSLLNATEPDAEVVTALQTDAASYTWPAAAVGSQSAAGLQLASGEPVMSIGGFNGSDPSPTLEQFQQYVQEGKIHYLLASELGGRQNGGSQAATEILEWAGENYATVTIGNLTFYDLTQPGNAS